MSSQSTGGHPFLDRLLGWQQRLQRVDHRRPWILDTGVVISVVLLGLPAVLGGQTGPPMSAHRVSEAPPAVLLLLHAGLALPLWWRRRAPAVAFSLIAVTCVTQWIISIWLPSGISLLLVLYSLALYGALKVLPWAAAVTIAGLGVAAFRSGTDQPWIAVFFLVGTATAALALGLVFRIRRAYLAALEDRATRLQIEQDQRARLTAAAERSRVAREMHDIVGHNLAVIVGLADGAASLASSRPERSAEALNTIAGTARQALKELRRVLGVLRADSKETELAPQPALADLEALIERVRAAGTRITYRTSGSLAELSSGVQLTVYRIVQEALTNTLKHVGYRSSVRIFVEFQDGRVRVTITDTGAPSESAEPPPAVPDRHQAGHGIIGMRERAAMYGGTLAAGPRAGGGWSVDASFDVEPDAAHEGEVRGSQTKPGPGPGHGGRRAP
ncbi:sensor histidine kinase [Streptomyces sp. AP-93]|uniref:sensor histidine kinase n=1 Tax=Streptomyces sp. AP-93 TaxID=2929048 RepID=UPI001FB00547|nr:histidine kinase [Streptomyces sp. AP-93]MCJ0872636.1 histidine kinase [Streptomyces sp. AP-93]